MPRVTEKDAVILRQAVAQVKNKLPYGSDLILPPDEGEGLTHIVKLSSATAQSNRYPGHWYERDADADTLTQRDTAWVKFANTFTPNTTDYYLARLSGMVTISSDTRVEYIVGLVGGGASTFSGARVYKTSNQSINNSTLTSLTFDSERFDTDSYHSTSTNTNRLTVPSTGKYLIGANIYWASNTTGINRLMNINDSAGTAWASINLTGTGLSTTYAISTLVDVTATPEWFDVQVLQDSGGNLNVQNSPNAASEFWITKLG